MSIESAPTYRESPQGVIALIDLACRRIRRLQRELIRENQGLRHSHTAKIQSVLKD
jgi:hypothetical protein